MLRRYFRHFNNDSNFKNPFLQNKLYSLALIISAFGVILFLILALVAPFRSSFFNILFPKPYSHASSLTDWPQLQNDPTHAGRTTVQVDPPFEVAWAWMDKTHIVKNFVSAANKSITDGFEQSYTNTVIFASDVQPIVVNNIAYFGAMNGTMYAVDAATGDNKWDFTSNGAIMNTAASDQNILVFGSQDGKVYGLNATTGVKIWDFQTGAGVVAAPLINNGVIYIGSKDGKFYALDLLTGILKWSQAYTTRVEPADANSPYNGAPIISDAALSEDGTTVFFGAENMFFYALNTTDGSEKWSPKKLVGQSFKDTWPVVKNGKVIIRTMSSLPGSEQVELGDVETMLDNLCSKDQVSGKCTVDPNWATEKSTWLDYLNTNPYQKTMYVLDETNGTEPYQVAMGRVTGYNLAPFPPVVDNQDRLLTYWRSARSSFFQDGPSYGTIHCPDFSQLDLSTGDRIRLPTPMTTNFCPELDNGFQPTVGGDNLYLFQPFRGLVSVNFTSGTLTKITQTFDVFDCGTNARLYYQIVYYGNDNEPTPCSITDPRPTSSYRTTWGITGASIASVNTTPMLFVNETWAKAIVGIRHKSP